MCPSCHSNDISRSRKRKLKDHFMRWMGKVAYRCRDCQKRFYVDIGEDRRLRRAHEWQRRSEEHHASEAGRRKDGGEDDFAPTKDAEA
jgi:transposase-like protein